MNNNMYDALEVCLQEIGNGVALENVLARFPDLADELRPILDASLKARNMAASTPSPEVVRRGRAKLLQRASQMREAKAAPRRKRVIPTFQRLAISLGLTATFLLSGTGLVGASASALPGENLYPVKRTWEGVQLFFIFNKDTRDALKSQFETERLHEANKLLSEGRNEVIQFAGVFMQANGTSSVSGVTVLLPANAQMPDNGVAVIVTGRTNAQGSVELESISVLPDGAFVPVGQPVQVDTESQTNSTSGSNINSGSNPTSESNSNDGSDTGVNSGSGTASNSNGNDSGNVSNPVISQSFETDGVIESISNGTLVMNGKTLYLDNATITGNLQNGVKVEIKGYYGSDGRFMVTELKVKSSGNNKNNSDGNSNPGSSSNSGSDSNSTGTNGSDSGNNNHNTNEHSGDTQNNTTQNNDTQNNNTQNNNDQNNNTYNQNDSQHTGSGG